MQFVKKTWDRMVHTIIFLTVGMWITSVILAYYIGAVRGAIHGELNSDMKNPLKAKIESEKPFCYDKGVVYDVRRGKKSFIPEF